LESGIIFLPDYLFVYQCKLSLSLHLERLTDAWIPLHDFSHSQTLLDPGQLVLKVILSREELTDEHVFPFNFFLENLDHEIFRLQHILQIPCQRIETMVGT